MALFLVKSTDVGAPTLSGVNGSLITVLDYALVTVAGWSKIFNGTNKGIYQPPNGLGYCLRVVHDSAVSGVAGCATVRGVESASGIDTFTNPYPNSTQLADTVSLWLASSTSTAVTRPYFFLISDGGTSGIPPFVYYGLDAASNNNVITQFWGEVVPEFTGDNYCSIISIRGITLGAGGNSYLYSFNQAIANNSSERIFWGRSKDGSVISSVGALMEGNLGVGNSNLAGIAPHPDTGGIIKRKLGVGDFYSTTTTIGANTLPLRGWVPNILSCLHSQGSVAFNLYDLIEDGQYDPTQTSTLMYIPTGASNTTSNTTLVDITTNWRKP